MAFTTINKSSSFMNTKLYTGNGSTQTITGVGFSAGLTWIKGRDAGGESHRLTDVVRGTGYNLRTNANGGQDSSSNTLTSWNSDGFALGANDSSNKNTKNFASWNWKAETAVSGSTTGSGTAKTYTGSVNATAGFSIIKYTGNGTNGMTIPHHLGAVPKMIIVKRLDAGSWNWQVYHTSLGATKYIGLNDTTGAGTSSSRWYDVEPTSSVFTLGNDSDVNVNDATFVAYVFAEKQGYSKFAQYTGNNNANGPFIYTGFKPSFVMIKNASISTNWVMIDNKRPGFNSNNYFLSPNLSNAETTNYGLEILSNGFKPLTNLSWINESGSNIIYMAFGQTLVGTNNIPNNAR